MEGGPDVDAVLLGSSVGQDTLPPPPNTPPIRQARRPGAQLTKDVSYGDSVKVTVVVAGAVVGRAGTITLTSKQ